MEKMREHNNLSSNLRGDQNCAINNETKRGIRENSLDKKKKEEEKGVVFSSLQKNNIQTDTKINLNNKSEQRTLRLANNENSDNVSISSKTSDSSSSSINTKDRYKSSRNINNGNTSNLQSFVGDTQKTDTKKKRHREAFKCLQKNNARTNIMNNPINNINTLQLIGKKDSEKFSVLLNTAGISNTNTVEYNNAEDTSDKDISTLQSLSKENTEKIPLEGKERNSAMKRKKEKKDRKALNYLRKNNTQFDIKMNNQKDKTHTSQLVNNKDCNDILSKTDSSIISTVEHGSITDTKDKAIFTLENSKYTFFNINYEFHEANHAIIDTFAVNIYFSLYTDNRKTYCLVCNTTFQIQDILQEHLYNHIKSNMHIQLLSQMIKDNKKSIKDGKLFSKLELARECMKSRNDIIECLLCDNKNLSSEIQNNDQLIYEHITSSEHQNSKVSWNSISVQNVLRDVHNCLRSEYNARNYRCEFCNYEGSSEIYFLKHLRVLYHTTRLTKFPDYAERFKFYFCAACLILWFGSLETYNLHCEQIEHKRKIKYGPDLDLPEKVIQFLIELSHNAEALLERSNSVRYNETINYVLYNLVNDLQIYIPNVKAYPFGSRISDLSFPDSDMDIFLDCDNMYEGRNSTHRHCRNLVTLVVYYLSLNKTWKVQDVILHSRTPIAKVLHIPSGLVCDISVTNGLAVENSKLIKCFNRAFPLCRKMVLFLKQWLHFCGLLGSHIITSYALTWFVIFYLQTLLVFPSISELIKLRNCSWRISGWEVGVSYDFPVRRIDHTFEELLLGFFMFYADFKYKIHVVCPLLGRPVEKDAFNFTNLSSLPKNMEPYVTYMRNVNAPEKPQAFTLSPLCVQDPFDLSHNLTKVVYSGKLSKFQSKCVYSIRILMKTFPYLKPPLLPYLD